MPVAHVDRWLDDLRALADARDDEALFRAVVTAILESYRQVPVYHRLMLFAALEDQELARIAQVEYTTPISSFSASTWRGASRRAPSAASGPNRRPHAAQRGSPVREWKALGVNPLGLSDRDIAGQAVALLAGLRA